ncbi:MAG: DUF3857 and transglutaminase domain-containing protein, partial [Planctomycetes bacterium]|nr:DUF3857 and transglutaminase domain-containing protein [Planctomycetota bacterium]
IMKRTLRPFVFSVLVMLIWVVPGGPVRAQDDDSLKTRLSEAGDRDAHDGASYLIVFDRTEADVQDSGLTYVTQKRLWKIFDSKGAMDLRTLSWNYDPLSGLVQVRAAKIIRKDGTVEEIPLDKVVDLTAPSHAIYWGLRDVVLPVGRLEPGDGLYVESFRKGFTYALLGEEDDDERFAPPMRGQFYDIVTFYDDQPISEKTYTALLPGNKPLQYEVYNGEVTSSIRFNGEKVAYTWTKKGIKPFKDEPNMVDQSDVAPKLLISTSPDWIAKSTWFYGVNEDYGSFEVTPEVQAKVDALLEGVTDPEEKVWILTHWCADNIRYSGISMGPGEGYTLHKGEMTFNDRCGVCKDKAGMLVTMLRAAGFESYAAMTMAGSRIDTIPADQFNHSVTLVKLKEGLTLENNPGFGDYKLLDPTWVPFMRELWSSAEQQQQYLPGVPEGADLQTTQLSPPENHYFLLEGTSSLDSDGDLEGAFTLTAEGQSDASLRWNLSRRRYPAVWEEYFYQAMHDISPRAEIRDLEYPDPYDLSEPIKIRISYRIPRYAVVAGDKMLFVPCMARIPFSDVVACLRMNLDLEDRDYAFRTRTSRLVKIEETVSFPKGFEALYLPEAESVSGGAADFEGGYKVSGNELYFEASLTLKKRIYEAAEYGNFTKAVKGLKHLMETSVALNR